MWRCLVSGVWHRLRPLSPRTIPLSNSKQKYDRQWIWYSTCKSYQIYFLFFSSLFDNFTPVTSSIQLYLQSTIICQDLAHKLTDVWPSLLALRKFSHKDKPKLVHPCVPASCGWPCGSSPWSCPHTWSTCSLRACSSRAWPARCLRRRWSHRLNKDMEVEQRDVFALVVRKFLFQGSCLKL